MFANGVDGVLAEDGRVGVLLVREEDVFVLVGDQVLIGEDKRHIEPESGDGVCEAVVVQCLLRDTCCQVGCNNSLE